MTAVVEHRDGEIERLRTIIKQLQRTQFGRRSERLDADQFALALEDLDSDIGRAEASGPQGAVEIADRRPRRKALPDHLPREEVVMDVANDACPCCGGVLHSIGESVSEMLDWVPASSACCASRARSTPVARATSWPRRPRRNGRSPAGWRRRRCSPRCWSANTANDTPLYRQAQIFARHGVELERSTLAGWVGSACWWLKALDDRLRMDMFASDHLFADDTPVPVLDPGRGRTKTGRLWVYARDQRPWGGPAPPAAVYIFAPDRRAERPAAHLERFKGVLHVDGYAGFERLTIRGDVVLAACWAHTRRKFYEVVQTEDTPLAHEALRRIAGLYAVEAQVRGQSSAHRLAARRTLAKPIVDALQIWLETLLPHLPGRGKLAEAVRYALAR